LTSGGTQSRVVGFVVSPTRSTSALGFDSIDDRIESRGEPRGIALDEERPRKTTMSNKKPVNKSIPKVRTNLNAGGPVIQHGLRVRTGARAGGPVLQHGVRVKQASR
jgi:hypothetical protein